MAEGNRIVYSAKRRHKGDLVFYSDLKGGCREVRVGLLSLVRVMEQEVTALRCTRAGLDIRKISSRKW